MKYGFPVQNAKNKGNKLPFCHRLPIPKRSFANKQTIVWLYANSSVFFDDVSLTYLMFGSSSPIPFFLSTTFSTKPRMRAAIPKQASMTSGQV